MGVCQDKRDETMSAFIEGNKKEIPFGHIGVVEANNCFGTGILIRRDVVLTSQNILITSDSRQSLEPKDITFYPARIDNHFPFSFSKAKGYFFKDNSKFNDFALIFLENEIIFNDPDNKNKELTKLLFFSSIYSVVENEFNQFPLIMFTYPVLDKTKWCLFVEKLSNLKSEGKYFTYHQKYREGINGSPIFMERDENLLIVGIDISNKEKCTFQLFTKKDIILIGQQIKNWEINTKNKSIMRNSSIPKSKNINNSANLFSSNYNKCLHIIRKSNYIFRKVDDINIDRPFCYIGVVKSKFNDSTGILIDKNIVLINANSLYSKESFRHNEIGSLKFIPAKNHDNCPFDSIDVIDYYFPENFKISNIFTWGLLILDKNIGEKINQRFRKSKYYSLIDLDSSYSALDKISFFNYSVNSDNKDILIEGKGPLYVNEEDKNIIEFAMSEDLKLDTSGGVIIKEINDKKYIIGIQCEMNNNNMGKGFLFNKEIINEISDRMKMIQDREIESFRKSTTNFIERISTTPNNHINHKLTNQIDYNSTNQIEPNIISQIDPNSTDQIKSNNLENINIRKIKITNIHKDLVNTLIHLANYDKDNDIVATCSKNEIKIWKLSTSSMLKEFSYKNIEINCLIYIDGVINNDNKYLVFGDSNNNVCVKSILLENEDIILKGHTDQILCICHLNNFENKVGVQMLLTGSKDTTVKIWDLKLGVNFYSLNGHTRFVWSLVFLSEYGLGRNYFASGGADYLIIIWQYMNETPKNVLKGHKNKVTDLIHPINFIEKDCIISAALQEIRIWKISTGECINVLMTYDEKMSNLVYLSEYGQSRDIVATACNDIIRLWKLYKPDYVKQINSGKENGIACLLYLESKIFGKHSLCCVTKEKAIKLWDI